MEQNVEKCVQLMERASFMVVLSGAGISTNAGMPDFRGPEGIYTTGKYDPERTFNIHSFINDPKPFYIFARDLVKILNRIRPTFTHFFLAELEREGKIQGIITQNIDGLHQKAGSKKVVELHGNFRKSFCLRCKGEFTYEKMQRKIFEEQVPRCSCGGTIKPDIVFFGELVRDLDKAKEFIQQSDLLFVIGSSLTVYPAALLPEMTNGKIVLINKEKVSLSLDKIVLRIEEDIDCFFKRVSNTLRLKVQHYN